MAAGEVEQWLLEGITAVKAGNREQARTLFMQVIAADKENESAWLWLSSVVEKEDDQRICLENVLTINPDNAAAWRRLEALNNPIPQPAAEPLGPPIIEYRQVEQFDDVWTQNIDICGYCATPVTVDENKCPGCKRKLIVKAFRYPQPTFNLTAVWLSLIFMSLLFAVQFGYSRTFSDSIFFALTGGAMVALLLIAAAGVYFRKTWAYALAIVLLVLTILTGSIQLLFSPDITPIEYTRLDPSISNVFEPITNSVWVGILVVQIIAAVIVLVFAFRASADFDRTRFRQIALPSRNLKRGIEYHTAATKLAKAGLWATAVKNWQRAVALEPNRISFQKELGQAYARLGFKERSLDVLQAAKTRTKNKNEISELDLIIQTVQSEPLAASGKR